ncbi:MAG: class I SAM-dependent methyltransferase [Acidobacteria bacterium]|nr:class I SAM-dependent methyltransferase [Acidobacteriota bacterium]
MPSSDSNQIPAILKLVSEARPASILDLGIGWGKYGALFRLCLEDGHPNVSDRRNWKLQIDGIEAFPEYVGDIQRAIYDRIILADVQQALAQVGDYDVIFMGDVIEHLEKKAGYRLLNQLLVKARQRVIIATPNGPYAQEAIMGNAYECHQSFWSSRDFMVFEHYEIYCNRKTLIAVLSRSPIPPVGRRWQLVQFRRYPLVANFQARLRYRWARWMGKA